MLKKPSGRDPHASGKFDKAQCLVPSIRCVSVSGRAAIRPKATCAMTTGTLIRNRPRGDEAPSTTASPASAISESGSAVRSCRARPSGDGIAAIWSEALGRAIRYGGADPVAMEQRLKTMMPAWHAFDLKLMIGRYQSEGSIATAEDIARLTALLGHAPRSYRDFAKDAAAQWAKS